LRLDRLFVVRTEQPLWAFEQSLISGACEAVLVWAPRAPSRDIRRLQLAAEKGRALGVLFRPVAVAKESSNAVLRAIVEPTEHGARVSLLKSRGGHRGSVELLWSSCSIQGPTQGRIMPSLQPRQTVSSHGPSASSYRSP
jgi:hypothetical protein